MVALSAAILGLTIITRTLISVVTGAVGQIATAPLKIAGAASKLATAFTGLDLSIKNLSKVFTKSIQAADELQKRNLALGRDFAGFKKAVSGQVAGMKSFGVLSERLGTVMTMMEAGLRGNTVHTARLTQSVRATGGNWKALAGNLEQLQTGLGLNNQSLDNLSIATFLARDTYGVAAEQIVAAVGSLTADVKHAAVLSGKSGPLTIAIANLSGRLGGRGGDLIGSLSELLLGSGKTLAEAAILGVSDERRSAQRGGAAEIEAALLSIINQAPRLQAKFERMRGDTGIATDAIKRWGEHIQIAIKLNNLLKTENVSLTKAMRRNRNATDQIAEIKKRVWEGIQEIWLDGASTLFETLLDNAKEIESAFQVFVVAPLKRIIETFSKVFLEQKTFKDLFVSLFSTIGKFMIGVETLLSGLDEGESLYSRIVGMFSGVALTLARMFDGLVSDFIPKLEMGFFGLLDSLLQLIHSFRHIPGMKRLGFEGVDQTTLDATKDAASKVRMDYYFEQYNRKISEGWSHGTAIPSGALPSTEGLERTLNMFNKWDPIRVAWGLTTADVYDPITNRNNRFYQGGSGALGEDETKEEFAYRIHDTLVQMRTDLDNKMRARALTEPKIGFVGRLEENLAKWNETAAEGSEKDSALKAMWEEYLVHLKSIDSKTKAPEEEGATLFDEFASTQAETLGNSIRSILMSAKEEERLRLLMSVQEELTGIRGLTEREIQVLEDTGVEPGRP